MEDKLKQVLSHPFNEIISDGKLIISLLQCAEYYLGLSYTDCQIQQKEYFEKLKTVNPKNIKQHKMEAQKLLEKKFILRGNTLLYYNSTHFNNETLTDKIAEAAIKRFPNLVGLFLNEKERAVLEAKDSSRSAIAAAEAAVLDEAPKDDAPDVIGDLLAEGKVDEAKAARDELKGNEKGKASRKINAHEKANPTE